MLQLAHVSPAPSGTPLSKLESTPSSPFTNTLSQVRRLTATFLQRAQANLPFLAAGVGAPAYPSLNEADEAVKATTEYLDNMMAKLGLKKHKDGSDPGGSQPSGRVQVGYFTNWGVYGTKYFPADVPLDSLTHILYSFANVKQDSGEVYLTDAWADEQMRYTEAADQPDTWNDAPGATNLYGALKRFALLKRKNRSLKLMLSIGGWTYSSNFWPSMSTEAGRKTFADTALRILEDYGFDGIDIDWEYPNDAQQAKALTSLLREVRTRLDEAERKREGSGTHFFLTVAASAAKSKIETMDIKGMDSYLDFWNLMTYDYAGSWSQTAGHQANLFPSRDTSPASEASADEAVQCYLRCGVPANKLVLGLPLYGRSFANTAGLGQPFSGTGEGGKEGGFWDVKTLPPPGAQVVEDSKAGASYSYDPAKKQLISFDSVNVFDQKGAFIKKSGLLGAMYWELSGDYTAGSQVPSMVPRVAKNIGPLEDSPNCLSYPESKFDNLRNGFQ